ncbi:hypothetical protein PL75_11560, partial [Neisseria arctica]
IYGDDGIREVLFQGEQGDGSTIMETFVSRMLGGDRVLHTADKHCPAVVMHIAEKAKLASCLGKAAVCSN